MSYMLSCFCTTSLKADQWISFENACVHAQIMCTVGERVRVVCVGESVRVMCVRVVRVVERVRVVCG